jgi:predicted O-methyltransferase YrrM
MFNSPETLFFVIVIAIFLIFFAALLIALRLRKWHWELRTQVNSLRLNLSDAQENASKNLLHVERSIHTATRELLNAVSISALDFTYPVMLGGASIDGHHARTLLFYLQERKPRYILELGSGSSSVLIAKALAKMGHPAERHVAVDHEIHFLNLTRETARLNGVDNLIVFEHCPLEKQANDAPPWYSRLPEIASKTKFDLLLIDGPPATGEGLDRSREPALDVLAPHLAPGAIVILDDANRPGEQAIIEAWRKRHPQFRVVHVRDGKGVAVLLAPKT